MAKAKRPTEVFVSHSHRDRDFAARLTRVLRKHKIRYWYSPKHIVGAAQWHDEIGKALARCDWFVIILTPNAVNSPWVKRELLYALNDARYQEHIIPLLVRPCAHARLSWTLQQIEAVDFRAGFDQGCADLLRIWDPK
jgi:hypothetical protein